MLETIEQVPGMIWNFAEIVSVIITLVVIIKFVVPILTLFPLFLKLAKNRYAGKILIYAENDTFNEIKSNFSNTRIFRDKNILQLFPSTLEQAEEARVIIVDYEFAGKLLQEIIDKKKKAGLLVLAKPGQISPDDLDSLSTASLTSVVNFRGRLVSDATLMMLSTKEV